MKNQFTSLSTILINRLKSFPYAISGLKTVFQDDSAFKLEMALSLIIVPLALFIGTTAVERCLLIGSWFLTIIIEAINSTIEVTVNRISLEIHPLSKKIKDTAAAAVLLSLINAIIIWSIILVSHLS